MDGHNIEDDDFFELDDDDIGLDKCNDHIIDDKPKEELAFETLEEADLFYNSYGTRIGFNVRRCHKGYNKQKTIVMNSMWECSQSGFPRIRKKPLIRKPKPQTRFGCRACFQVALQDGLYKVTKFVTEHNHELLNPTSNKLKSNRYLQYNVLYRSCDEFNFYLLILY